MTTAEIIKQLAATEADHIGLMATKLLERAIKDGDELPAVTVSMKFTVGKSNGKDIWEAEAKAERKQVEKTEKLTGESDPNQPELWES